MGLDKHCVCLHYNNKSLQYHQYPWKLPNLVNFGFLAHTVNLFQICLFWHDTEAWWGCKPKSIHLPGVFFYQTSMKTPRGLHDIQSFNTQWTGCIYIWGLHVFAHQHYSAYRRHKAPNVGNVVYAGFLSCFHPQAFQHKSELKLRFMLLLPSSAWYQVLQTKKKSPSDDTVRSDLTKNKKNKTWFV